MTTVPEYRFGSGFLDKIAEWVKDNLAPEDVFDTDLLEDWAFDNGFKSVKDIDVNEYGALGEWALNNGFVYVGYDHSNLGE